MAKIHLPPYKQTVLIFQGGGALGSYQAGVYDGIANAGIEPTWVSGISIGAINAALVAGNPPEKRVERLRDFWDTVCRPPSMSASFMTKAVNMMGMGFAPFQESVKHTVDKAFGSYAATMAILEGQNEFFYPRPFAPLALATQAKSVSTIRPRLKAHWKDSLILIASTTKTACASRWAPPMSALATSSSLTTVT